MNPYLAALYNTNGYAEVLQDEQTKVAAADLFCKAAAAEGIDLSALDENTRASLYENFLDKLAEEEEEGPKHEKGESKEKEKGEQEEGDDDEKKAMAEFQRHAEWQQKTAEADFLGRQMAHAFMSEKDSIEKQAKKEKMQYQPEHKATMLGVGKGAPGGTARQTEKGPVLVKSFRDRAKELGGKAREIGGKGLAFAGRHKGKAALIGGGLAVGTGAGVLASHAAKKKDDDEKTSSAFDLRAAEEGLKIASAYGFDEDEAVNRLNAVLTLGAGESEKIAHAGGDYDTALQLRGLELLETAGYPIAWDEILG